MDGRSGRLAPAVAALAAGALLAIWPPPVSGAESGPSLRARSAELAASEHQALLLLYAAESSHARARSELARLEARSDELAAEEASAARLAGAAQRSLSASQARVADLLKALYVEGPADPIAVILGATSLEEAITGIESLRRSAAQNRHLAARAREQAERLAVLQARLEDRRAALDEATAGARAAESDLASAVAQRAATVAAVRTEAGLNATRLAELEQRAREAERVSKQVTEGGSAAASSAPAPQTPAPGGVAGDPAREEQGGIDGEAEHTGDPAAEPDGIVTEPEQAAETPPPGPALPPPGGSITLVVDAVAYHLPGNTASGIPVGVGVIAVDPSVIPLGTRVFVPGYGPAVAADTGSAIKGNIIDLWMPSTAEARAWGRRTVTITIYG